MSISSSMNAGVAGLAAQATNLATISDNIANSATAGYKRATTEFSAMVIGSNRTTYTAGGVQATSLRQIDARGSLTSTANSTDLAITGRGMLPVTTANDVAAGGDDLSFMMTTTGSFSPDSAGYLRTPSNMVLLGIPVGDDGAPPQFSRTSTADLVPVQISTNEIVGLPTTAMTVTANLPAASTEAGATGGPEALSMTYYDNLGKAQTLSFTITPTVPAAGAPPSNTWAMSITDEATGTVVGNATIVFDDDTGQGGRIETVTSVPAAAYDAATGMLSVNVASGPIDITIGRPNQPGGFTQLASKFTPLTMTKDGAAASSLTGIEVDPNGYVVASYSTGATRRLYQIPVVDVPNPNGLTSLSNQTYTTSQSSGDFMLWNAGDGPTGAIQGYAREESAVDVAKELTQLIRTQRAYSSNAKVIQTVDEMLQETTNIKR
ncbi:flagellar hook protein FlgE [Rubellimicrobium rubrum]|uniref:Flagellar hook protein FlgE n=1 Tax=Rubellimicrobium rubrum TaxID=2585369 RepID=A0A5C4N2H7_9RHOB|nr:flagellar hook protein FlgE [Rubellimicrobium rubrum]TNC51584.1 flagellar hook protein FlgE [Rubellimicrobium rubrum]